MSLLETDADGKLTFAVRETIADVEFTNELRWDSRNDRRRRDRREGYRHRVSVFTDLVTEIGMQRVPSTMPDAF